MGPEQYLSLANHTAQAIRDGYAGVVIGHGTDTMHYTSAALSFMVQNSPIPIVMVAASVPATGPPPTPPKT